MRRALTLAIVLAGLVAEPALALAPGAPRHVRAARAADAHARPHELMEDWTVHLVDPRSKAHVGLRMVRSPDEGSSGRLEIQHGGRHISTDDIAFPAGIAHRGRSWKVRVSSPTAEGEIHLARVRPGITAQRWRLGREAGSAEHVTMSWSTPVLTSRVSGSVRVGDKSVSLRGWRGTLEHRWGTISRDWRAWEHLGAAVVHTRGGSAWMLEGLNRRDLLTGPGARDAFWLGLLVHATPARTTFCRPRVVRRGWLVSLEGPLAVTSISAKCGGHHVRFRRTPETLILGNEFGPLGEDSRATARPRGPAWIRYAGHNLR